MKDYKIGKLTVQICESLEDLNIKRHVAVKAQMIKLETGEEIPSLKKHWIKMRKEFDMTSPSGMLLEMHEFINGLNNLENMEDADQMIFALITLDKDEHPGSLDKNMLLKKLERFSEAGLKQGDVKKEVANFISGSIFK